MINIKIILGVIYLIIPAKNSNYIITMSHHRTYEETYGDVPKRSSNYDSQLVNDKSEGGNEKFGEHSSSRKTQERPTEGVFFYYVKLMKLEN